MIMLLLTTRTLWDFLALTRFLAQKMYEIMALVITFQ